MSPIGQIEEGYLAQTPEAIADWIELWATRFPEAQVHICLETSRGPLINALLEYSQVRVYPINPNALANYHKAFAHGGGKNDPVDAKLILQYLMHYREDLQSLRQDAPLTRELAALSEDRRRLVDQRVAFANGHKSLLKAYFPAILALTPAKMYARFMVRLLLKYATLTDVQAAGRTKLRNLFISSWLQAKSKRTHRPAAR